jgi:hypothetical protein
VELDASVDRVGLAAKRVAEKALPDGNEVGPSGFVTSDFSFGFSVSCVRRGVLNPRDRFRSVFLAVARWRGRL